MLDEISLKIMAELCQDGRSSNAKLAKKLGVSVVTVSKRINAMIDEGVISIKAAANPFKMGYQANAVIGLDVELPMVDDICARLTGNPNINLVLTCFGRFDVLMIVAFADWNMLQDFVKDDLSGLEGVRSLQTYLISKSQKRYQSVFHNRGSDDKPAVLDEIDRKLIEELIHVGRPNYADLARKFGISLSTVSRRISNLVREDIIKIIAIPNPSKLGYAANAFIFLRTELAKADKICEKLSDFPEVHLVMRLMNDFDVILGVNFSSPEMLYDFLSKKIATIDGVVDSETFIRGNFLYFSAEAPLLPSMGLSR